MNTPNMTYDQAMARAEEVVRSLEQSDAISVAEYKQQADEAKRLLDYCESQIKQMEKDYAN